MTERGTWGQRPAQHFGISRRTSAHLSRAQLHVPVVEGEGDDQIGTSPATLPYARHPQRKESLLENDVDADEGVDLPLAARHIATGRSLDPSKFDCGKRAELEVEPSRWPSRSRTRQRSTGPRLERGSPRIPSWYSVSSTCQAPAPPSNPNGTARSHLGALGDDEAEGLDGGGDVEAAGDAELCPAPAPHPGHVHRVKVAPEGVEGHPEDALRLEPGGGEAAPGLRAELGPQRRRPLGRRLRPRPPPLVLPAPRVPQLHQPPNVTPSLPDSSDLLVVTCSRRRPERRVPSRRGD